MSERARKYLVLAVPSSEPAWDTSFRANVPFFHRRGDAVKVSSFAVRGNPAAAA